MTTKQKGTIMCDVCKTVECRHDYPNGIPAYCLAKRFPGIIEETKREYSTREVIEIYKAAAKVVTNGYGRWPRIQEAIEFAKELKFRKIGFASCVGLIRELGMITELFMGAGFQTVSASCQIGRVGAEARGINMDSKEFRGLYCNPIAQAEILNHEGTELNFILGLCLGHDIEFIRYSKAPASTLIVKDRVLGHNPAAALYTQPHRRNLWKIYCGQDID